MYENLMKSIQEMIIRYDNSDTTTVGHGHHLHDSHLRLYGPKTHHIRNGTAQVKTVSDLKSKPSPINVPGSGFVAAVAASAWSIIGKSILADIMSHQNRRQEKRRSPSIVHDRCLKGRCGCRKPSTRPMGDLKRCDPVTGRTQNGGSSSATGLI